MAEIGKKYKLLKDLPTFKAGDIFTLMENGGLRLSNATDERNKEGIHFACSAQTLKKFPEILKEWFEEIPEEHKRWRAEKSREYWYIDNLGLIYWSIEMRSAGDDFCYNTGNYFRTKEEAEKDREYQIALQTLKDDANGFVPDWNDNKQLKWYVEAFATSGECFNIDFTLFNKGFIYFSSMEDAEESIKLHPREWKIVLGMVER